MWDRRRQPRVKVGCGIAGDNQEFESGEVRTGRDLDLYVNPTSILCVL